MNFDFSNQIKAKFNLPFINHMTHIKNLKSILEENGLRSYNLIQNSSHISLANEDVQKGRASITVKSSGRPLHDYVPIYFGFKTPMVAWNQNRNEDLIFLRFPLEILQIPGAIITDGNARATRSSFYPFQIIDDLSRVDTKAIQTLKYAHDQDLKRRKQAEILIPDFLPISYLYDIICFSDNSRNELLNIIKIFNTTIPLKVNKGWYYIQTSPSGVQK